MNWDASLFVGIPAEKILKIEKKKTKQTRYDEYTGKPYQKEWEYEETILLGEIQEEDEDIDAKLNAMGLYAYPEMNDYPELIGEYITVTQDSYVTISQRKINETKVRVTTKLQKLGIHEQVKLFLCQEVS